jgi:hypothetical protein
MRIDKLSLPHPVLGLGDDVNGFYRASPAVKLGRQNISVIINHGVSNKTIESLLNEKAAAFCTEINCPQTFYRKAFLTTESSQIIEIPSDELRNKTEINFYIVAAKDISGYSVDGANEDYRGFTFEIEKGDVLGYGGRTFFIAAKRWEDIKALSSLMVIKKSEREKGPFEVDLNSDKIVVYLSEQDFNIFRRASRHGFDSIFHSSIVVPVLMHALNQMMGDDEGNLFENHKWYQILEFRKNDEGLDRKWSREYITEIAQTLLANPLTRTLSRVEEIIDSSFIPES